MFFLFDEESGTIHIISIAATRIVITPAPDDFGGFDVLLWQHEDYEVLFHSSHLECEFFLLELFAAMLDKRGVTLQALIKHAQMKAIDFEPSA